MHMRACGLEEGTARVAGVHCASQSAPATVAIAEPQVALIRNSHVESSALLQESRLTLHREILRQRSRSFAKCVRRTNAAVHQALRATSTRTGVLF